MRWIVADEPSATEAIRPRQVIKGERAEVKRMVKLERERLITSIALNNRQSSRRQRVIVMQHAWDYQEHYRISR